MSGDVIAAFAEEAVTLVADALEPYRRNGAAAV